MIVFLVTTMAVCAAPLPRVAKNVLPLEYDKALIELGFPSPLLRATVKGRRIWFIIDTGASVHTLASWVVNAAHLETRESKAKGTGSTGAETPVRVCLQPVG